MRRRDFGYLTAFLMQLRAQPATVSVRQEWVALLDKIARPVVENLAGNTLRQRMPVEAARPDLVEGRRLYTHLEAFGRTMCGIAPWLDGEGGDAAEQALRARYRDWADAALSNAVDPKSPDYLEFRRTGQSLVDAAFLGQALLRAPKWFALMGPTTRQRLVSEMMATRATKPGFNNWLLFSAMVEMLLREAGADWDRMRVDYALRQHEQWYKGDGMYGDGPDFHWDYYNSYVIQPMLVEILTRLPDREGYGEMRKRVLERAQRYAAIQERLIAADGSFPVIGRSICYRSGAFQHLADQALRKTLPASLKPAQVRGALTAMQRRCFAAAGTFDANGWLTLGLAGHQAGLAETYISTGSLYLCTFSFLPLGLPESDAFWADAEVPWTQKAVWGGADLPADKAIK